MDSIQIVDMQTYRTKGSKVFAGRDRGVIVRNASKLASLEEAFEQIEVRIPEDTFSVNASFFLGMFGDSIRSLGEEGFRRKYSFKGKDLSRVVDNCVREALRISSPLPAAN